MSDKTLNNREQSTDEEVSTELVNCSNSMSKFRLLALCADLSEEKYPTIQAVLILDRASKQQATHETTTSSDGGGGGGGSDEGEQFVCSSSGCSTSSLDQVENATTTTVKGQDRKTDVANHDSTGATASEGTMIPTPPLSDSPKAYAGVSRSVSLPSNSVRTSTNSTVTLSSETESPLHHSPTPPRFRKDYTPLDPDEETRRLTEMLQGIQRRHEEQREKEVQQAEQRFKRMTSLPSLPSQRWDHPVVYDAGSGGYVNQQLKAGVPQPKPNYTETPTTYRGDTVVAELEARIAEQKKKERRYQLELAAKVKEIEEERTRRRQEEEEQAKKQRAEERRLKQEELHRKNLAESPSAYRNDPVIVELEKKLAERKAADRQRQEEQGAQSGQQKMAGTVYNSLTNTFHNPRSEPRPRPTYSETTTSYREDPLIAELEARITEHKAAERLRTRELAAKAREREEEIARLLQQEKEEEARRRAEWRRAKQEEIDQKHQEYLENEAWRLERIRQLSLKADLEVLTGKKNIMATFDERRAEAAREEEVARMKALEERVQRTQHRETTGSMFYKEIKERPGTPETLQKSRTWADLKQEERARRKQEEVEKKEQERLQRAEYRAKCRELNRQAKEERSKPSATVETNRRDLEEVRAVLETRRPEDLHFDVESKQPPNQQHSPAPPRSDSPSTTAYRPRCVTPSTTEELEAYEVVPTPKQAARREREDHRKDLERLEEDRRKELEREEEDRLKAEEDRFARLLAETVEEENRLARLQGEEEEEEERRTVRETEHQELLTLHKAMRVAKSKAEARHNAKDAAEKQQEKKKGEKKKSSTQVQKLGKPLPAPNMWTQPPAPPGTKSPSMNNAKAAYPGLQSV